MCMNMNTHEDSVLKYLSDFGPTDKWIKCSFLMKKLGKIQPAFLKSIWKGFSQGGSSGITII